MMNSRKPVKSKKKQYTSVEEFRRKFYPKAVKAEAQCRPDNNCNFGTQLAKESLNRHVAVLGF